MSKKTFMATIIITVFLAATVAGMQNLKQVAPFSTELLIDVFIFL